MNISEKITQMRLEPQHVRLRYVWISVAISMVFIIAIWIFSVTLLFKNDVNTAEINIPALTEGINNNKQTTPSIQDIPNQEKGNSSGQNFQYPSSQSNNEIPQTNAYSELNTGSQSQ
jgi:hypothetical protein